MLRVKPLSRGALGTTGLDFPTPPWQPNPMPELSDVLDDGAYSQGPHLSFQRVHGVTAVTPCRPSPLPHPVGCHLGAALRCSSPLSLPLLPTHASVPQGFPETTRQGLFNKLTTAADGSVFCEAGHERDLNKTKQKNSNNKTTLHFSLISVLETIAICHKKCTIWVYRVNE